MVRRGLPWRVPALVGLGGVAVSWLLTRWWIGSGHRPVEAPWLAAVLLVVMAVVVLVLGWPLRQYRRGGASVPALRAARILGLAQASALTGAVVAGCYAGHAVPLLADLGFARTTELTLRLGLAALGGVLVVVAGLVVQAWCRVRPDDPSEESGARD